MYHVPVSTIQAPPELVSPDYTIYQYRPDFYKVIRFKTTTARSGGYVRDNETGYKNDDKLPQALSRARKACLEIALCNEWKWFCTFTIASSNFDRKNLDGFYERFSEWLKYKKKKYKLKIPYLLVPEQHGDGSWHMHGFFNSDIDQFLVSFAELYEAGADVPLKFVRKDFYNWPEYQKKFGFCSFGKIRNHDATAFYVTKYICKSFQGDANRVGLRLYYCSIGLNRSVYLDSIYGPCPPLDPCLVNDYEFCSTGFISFNRQPGDDPVLDLIEEHNYKLLSVSSDASIIEEFQDVVDYYEYTQECLWAL